MKITTLTSVETRTILIVGDKPENLFSLKNMLNGEDYNIITTTSFEEAQKIIMEEDISLVLLDIKMSDADGCKVAEILCNNYSTVDIPVIFLNTKCNKEKNMLKSLKNGAVDCLTKPVTAEILRIKVDNYALRQQRFVRSKLALLALKKTNEALTEYNKAVESSIKYAKTIQQSVLPNEEIIRQVFPESFIYYKPKDIVSGDFYWFTIKNSRAIVAAVDCTGHGVPGALLSMIGNNLLNQIVNEKNLTKPSDILSQLNNGIIKTFNQNADNGNIRDGMDIALLAFDLNFRTVEFAGAFRPLYHFRGNELNVIKGNACGIDNLTPMNHDFTNHIIDLKQGDTLYIFSDGYQDQFGGPRNKKFMINRFRKLLKFVQTKGMEDQKKILDRSLKQWMNGHWQVDDIMVMGFKV
ncbi:MAG: response regulator [Bacteroidota bacterium]